MGTWMQSVAQGWLVYELTGSKLALGTISFVGTDPDPLFDAAGRRHRRSRLHGRSAGHADRHDGAGASSWPSWPARALQVWQIAVLAVILGIANSFDAPARQALAVEMVDDRRYLKNAIALNSTIFNLARVVGPAIGGLVLAALGAVWCFGLNGLSFVAVIIALADASPGRSGRRHPPHDCARLATGCATCGTERRARLWSHRRGVLALRLFVFACCCRPMRSTCCTWVRPAWACSTRPSASAR